MKLAQKESDKMYMDLVSKNSDNISKIKDSLNKVNRKVSFLGDHARQLHESEMKVTADQIKFTMFYDKALERFFICENSYELQKYFVLEYDEQRAKSGVGNHLMVTMYTVVGTNLLTAEIGRGQRGIEIDTKEIMALRNIVHFNCINPFPCMSCKTT